MKNPWKIKRSKDIYENDWIKTTHHDVLNPAGKDGVYGTIHFKNLAIGIVPLTDQLETFLVGQWRFPLNQYSWEIPEGGGKIGTDPLDTAKRELKEETGLVAKKWDEIQRIHTSNSVADELGILYLARKLEQFEADPDEDEQIEIKKLPFEDAFQMVLNNEITDSLSVAAIYKTHYLLQEKLLDL